MRNLRRDNIRTPRVSRSVLPKEELYVTDLDGNISKKMTWCSYHKKYEWVGEFYLESESVSKYPYQVRAMCIEAWDMVKGKVNPVSRVDKSRIMKKDKSERSKIDNIFMESVND
jgi:hypothetical protein